LNICTLYLPMVLNAIKLIVTYGCKKRKPSTLIYWNKKKKHGSLR